ncbi:cation-transporting ATPase, partial [Nephila pilipes]
GNCVVNESMLTGESTPITKVPVPNDPNTRFNTIVNKRNTLFCGTQVLHSRSVDGSPVKAIVYRTGKEKAIFLFRFQNFGHLLLLFGE